MAIVMDMGSYEIERDPDEVGYAQASSACAKSVLPRLGSELVSQRRSRIDPPGGWSNVDIEVCLERMYVFHR